METPRDPRAHSPLFFENPSPLHEDPPRIKLSLKGDSGVSPGEKGVKKGALWGWFGGALAALFRVQNTTQKSATKAPAKTYATHPPPNTLFCHHYHILLATR